METDQSSALAELSRSIERLEPPQTVQIIEVIGRALDAHADQVARAAGEAADAELALVRAAEQFLSLYRGTEAFRATGLDGSTFEELLRRAGGRHG